MKHNDDLPKGFLEQHPVSQHYQLLYTMIKHAYMWMSNEEAQAKVLEVCEWCGNDENTIPRFQNVLIHVQRVYHLPQVVRPSDPILTQPYVIRL